MTVESCQPQAKTWFPSIFRSTRQQSQLLVTVRINESAANDIATARPTRLRRSVTSVCYGSSADHAHVTTESMFADRLISWAMTSRLPTRRDEMRLIMKSPSKSLRRHRCRRPLSSCVCSSAEAMSFRGAGEINRAVPTSSAAGRSGSLTLPLRDRVKFCSRLHHLRSCARRSIDLGSDELTPRLQFTCFGSFR